MSVILLVSILIRLIALGWCVLLWRRVRDWSMGFLAIMLGLMALRQVLALGATHTSWSSLDLTAQVTEIPGLLVSVMAFLAVFFLNRMLDVRSRAADALRAHANLQEILLKELDHRVRNNLSSILSLIDLSQEHHTRVGDFAVTIRDRTETLSTVHNILSQSKWQGCDLSELIRAIAGAHGASLLQVEGPPLMVPLTQTQAIAMILNELTTNSHKYGAMGVAGGRTTVTWRMDESGNGGTGLTLTWREQGGPRIQGEPKLGTGLNLVKGIALSELRGDALLTFPPNGVVHTIRASLGSNATAQFATTASARSAMDPPAGPARE